MAAVPVPDSPGKPAAADPWSPAPGDAVYLPYNPRRVGMVITCGLDAEADLVGLAEVRMPGEGVAVAWEDGHQTVEWSSDLSSLDALISACERKLAGHLARRARLERATGAPAREAA